MSLKKNIKYVAQIAIIVIIVVCCNMDSVNKGATNMDIQYIDAMLGKIIEKDFEEILKQVFTCMKQRGYIRDDITSPLTGDPHMAQFLQLFQLFINTSIIQHVETEPKILNGVFRKAYIEEENNLKDHVEGLDLDVVAEIIEKKKKDMITKILQKLAE